MNEEECSICMEDLRDPDMEVYETRCGHKFHRQCLLNYCNISNPDRDLNHVGISCPLCNTGLNCRFNGGVDIFPERLNNNAVTVHNEPPPTNIVRALSVIPKGEYEIIDSVDDIDIPQLPNLTLEEKQLILAEILRRREAGETSEDEEFKGGKRKSSRRKQTNKKRKQTNKRRKQSNKRRKQTNKKRKYSKRRV
jgi:hypothetical protein